MKISKIAILMLIFVLAAMVCTACAGKKITYLNEEQNETLRSARSVPGTENQASIKRCHEKRGVFNER